MKIILVKDILNLGRSGDVKEVSAGYARNFLIPKHLALPATTSALEKIQKEQQEKQMKMVRNMEKVLQMKIRLHNKTITIKAKANKEILFAGLHEKDIAHAIGENLGVEISPDLIIMPESIKSIGLHQVKVRFAKDAEALVSLNIEAIKK